MFSGLSSLRAKEKVKQPVTEDAKKLQSYLAQQYGAGAAADGGDKEKKKKKKKKAPAPGGVRILDEDVTGFAAASTAAELAARAARDDDEGELTSAGACWLAGWLAGLADLARAACRGPCAG